NGPRDTSLLDAFDELGVMVLAGLPGSFLWGGPRFAQNSYQNARDLLRRDRNHPCIIAWELSINECWWPDEQFSPTMVRIGHDELPGSYIGGFKDHGGWGGPCWYDINITGPGNDHEKYDGPLPTIRHEYGHFPYGGVHSTSDVNRGDGEARMLEQATNHQHETNMLFSLPVSAYVGAGVFCYGDYASYPSGMVDKLRIPKFSYFFWKSQRDPSLNFGSLGIESGPMVFIANYWTLDSPQDVRVYSNCDEVKLYLNGKYLQSRTPDCEETSETPFRAAFKNTAVWHPPFTFAGVSKETGTLRADGYIKGEKSASHSVTTPGKPVRLAVRIETKGIGKAVTGVHVLPVYVALEDAADSVVPWGDRNKDKVLVQFECSGEAVIVGARTVRLEAGVAGTILKTTGEVGPVSVQATVDSGADGRRFKGTGTATLEVSKL
ncbi:MAG: Beta-galactosidase, partial [Candidatus Hydrogenedentota bacterium]